MTDLWLRMEPIVKNKAKIHLRSLPPEERRNLHSAIARLPYEPESWILFPDARDNDGLYYVNFGRHKVSFVGEKDPLTVFVLDINTVDVVEVGGDESNPTVDPANS